MNHEQACGHCHKYIDDQCSIYLDTSWVNRRGGCSMLPEREMPPNHKRVGQQKQKHSDRSYGSKNSRRDKYGSSRGGD